MSIRTSFGPWTLFAAVCWIGGLVVSGIVIWHLWRDWPIG
jgi:hypothetical protein